MQTYLPAESTKEEDLNLHKISLYAIYLRSFQEIVQFAKINHFQNVMEIKK